MKHLFKVFLSLHINTSISNFWEMSICLLPIPWNESSFFACSHSFPFVLPKKLSNYHSICTETFLWQSSTLSFYRHILTINFKYLIYAEIGVGYKANCKKRVQSLPYWKSWWFCRTKSFRFKVCRYKYLLFLRRCWISNYV